MLSKKVELFIHIQIIIFHRETNSENWLKAMKERRRWWQTIAKHCNQSREKRDTWKKSIFDFREIMRMLKLTSKVKML